MPARLVELLTTYLAVGPVAISEKESLDYIPHTIHLEKVDFKFVCGDTVAVSLHRIF